MTRVLKNFYCLVVLLLLSYRVYSKPLFFETDSPGTPCSTNTTTAWENIQFLIDVSTNMGAANLRQIQLTLASEVAKYTIGQGAITEDGTGPRFTSRFSIITYSDSATSLLNWVDVKELSQVQNAIMSAKISGSKGVGGLSSALDLAWANVNAIWAEDGGDIRRRVVVIFAAAVTNEIIQSPPSSLQNLYDEDDVIITVSYNPADKDLSEFLTKWADDSYNFTNTNTLIKDLEWAYMQSNCYCDFLQITSRDPKTGRLQKYADCGRWDDWTGATPSLNVSVMCFGDGLIAMNSQAKFDFYQQCNSFMEGNGIFGYYIGLHRNAQNQWVFLDYDLNEYPMGSFSAWAPGYSTSSPGDCVYADSTTTPPFLWKTGPCYPYQTNATVAICQHHACDASFDIYSTQPGTPGCGLAGGDIGMFAKEKTRVNLVPEFKKGFKKMEKGKKDTCQL